jgi:hypothetical protein
MAPCLPVGLLALGVCHYLRGNPWKVLVSRFVLFSAGFAIPAAPIMARNFILTHTLMGEGTLPITLDPYSAFASAFHSLVGNYSVSRLSNRGLEFLLGALLLGLLIPLVWRGRARGALRQVFLADGTYVLTLWALSYFAFVIYARTRTYFDLDPRTMLPAGVICALLIAGLAAASAGRRAPYLGLAAVALARETIP